jgi:uncharacterized protein (TIGR03437 family)
MGWTASAQTWDTSGNGLLSGQYYMRQVVWWVGDQYGDLAEATAVYGVITFDGNGNYSFNGDLFDPEYTGSNSAVSYTGITGTYTISASGFGYMDSLITDDSVYGLVSNGIFIGSTTENADDYNDLFIAAQIGPTQATNATLTGKYSIADLEYPAAVVDSTDGYYYARDSLTTFNADGNGNLSGVTSAGYIAANSGATNQSIGSVKYAFSNGAANLEFSGSYSNSNITSTLMVGSHFLYISPDGNFVFGGSPVGNDMFVGTRVSSGTASNFNGLYYQAGMDFGLSSGTGDPDSYYGSFYANFPASGQGIGHQRYAEWIYNGSPIDLTYADTYTFSSGASTDTGTNYSTGQYYVFGNNGAIRIGFGQLPAAGTLGISVALQAPSLSGSGPYINPTYVFNSASYALFTASLAPGELITLEGTDLAPSAAVTSNFATSLNGVQVMMNSIPSPVYAVAPTQIAAIVPYEIAPGAVVDIQVVNNGHSSNIVSTFAQQTQPGVFTNPADGVSTAIAQHLDYSLITTSSPAEVGETIITYMTGLGPVDPGISDGTAGGSNPPSETTNTIVAVIDGVQATVGYSGLVPGVIALYQMNITVPSGVTTGAIDNLDISGPDSYSTEATIPIGTGSAAVTANAATPHRKKPLLKAKGQGTRRVLPTHGPERTNLPFQH